MKTGKENIYLERDRKANEEKEVICLDSINSQRHLEKIVDFSLLQRHRARGYMMRRSYQHTTSP
jgi:hypothetical protein